MVSYFGTILIFLVGLTLTYTLTCQSTGCSNVWNALNLNNISLTNFIQSFFSNPANYGAAGLIFAAGLLSGNLLSALAASLVLSIITYINPLTSIINTAFGGISNPTDPLYYVQQAILLIINISIGLAAMLFFRGGSDL